jgi:hypothetical protein
VEAVGGEAQEDVALGDALGEVCPALHRAHGEACEVEVAAVVHARHLGGLAADQRAARPRAALGDPLMTRAASSTRSFPVAK